MKILILQDRLRSGGTERQSLLLTRAFSEAGHPTELLTFRPGGRLAPAAAGLAHRCLQPFDSGLDWWAPGLGRAVVAADPQIVLCMGKTANAFAGHVQRRLQQARPAARVVATSRSGYRLPGYYLRSVRQCPLLITNSHQAAALLATTYGLDPARLAVVHNSLIFPSALAGRDESLRAAHGAGPATTVLLSVGMFRPEKNQQALLHTLAGLPAGLDWQLWLAGEGPTRRACEALAGTLGLAARVKFLGFQGSPTPLYRGADIAVHASREESLSNFLIEAQAHGLPVVAAEALGNRECVRPGETGWIVPQDDAVGFRAAVERLAAADPAARARLAEVARAFARAAFDPARQVGAYLDLFTRLCCAPPRP